MSVCKNAADKTPRAKKININDVQNYEEASKPILRLSKRTKNWKLKFKHVRNYSYCNQLLLTQPNGFIQSARAYYF